MGAQHSRRHPNRAGEDDRDPLGVGTGSARPRRVKLLVLGPPSCGKSTMIKKILGDEDGDDQATSRRKASRPVKKMVLHDQVFEFEFREVGLAVDADLSMDMDIQKAGDFFLFLFPLDNSDKAVAVEEIRKMYNRVSSAIMKDSIAELAIVGTKSDVAASAAAAGTERFLTEDDLKPIHESLINAIYVEVSAQSGAGLEELMVKVANQCVMLTATPLD